MLSDLALQEIRRKYAPLDKAGKPLDGVLYVGPFLQGVVQLMPEFVQALRKPQSMAPRRNPIQVVKSYFRDTAWQEVGMAGVPNAYNFRAVATMIRKSWPKRSGNTPTLHLTRNVVTEEPGAMLNSVDIYRDPSTGKVSLVQEIPDMDHLDGSGQPRNLKRVPADILLRTDERYGLHYLLEGDYFEFTWHDVHKVLYQMLFRLRKEGSGLITPETSDTDMFF